MPNPNALPLLCLLAGCVLLQGCTTTTPSPIETAALGQISNPVIQKATQKSVQKMMRQAGKAEPTGTPSVVAAQSPAPVAVAQKALPAKQVNQVKTIKPGTPTAKNTGKLTPEEVEDMIRKLSVCKPH